MASSPLKRKAKGGVDIERALTNCVRLLEKFKQKNASGRGDRWEGRP